MVIVVAALAGIAAMALTGARLRRLADLRIHRIWLVWMAIGIQVGVLSVFARYLGGWPGNVIHLGTYALVAVFVLSNRAIPGVRLMGLGGGMNLAAIIANGGVMPASATAWEIAGHADKTGFANSMPVSDPRLLWFGDVFAIPAGWPFANVFSIGDVLLVLGVMWMVHRTCRRPRAATNGDVAGSPGAELVVIRRHLGTFIHSMEVQQAEVAALRRANASSELDRSLEPLVVPAFDPIASSPRDWDSQVAAWVEMSSVVAQEGTDRRSVFGDPEVASRA
jgi:hypothetical protein